MRFTQSLKIVMTFISVAFFSRCAFAYTSGNYPRLAQIPIPSQSLTLSQGEHPISYAIEQGMATYLLNQSELNANWQYLVPSANFSDDYLYRRITSNSLLRAVTPVIEDVICAEYRFRHRLEQSTHCTKMQNSHNSELEAMPFVSGQFTNSPAINDYEDRKQRISYEAYLPESTKSPLSTLEGSIHELGTFFGRFAPNNSLVLHLRLNFFALDGDGFRGSRINTKPISLWVVLPPAKELSRKPDQQIAAKFALERAQLLLIGKQRAW